IAIPAQSAHVSRPRLLKLLENNLASYNATIINGRAGTGETVLAAGFARRSGRALSWYKVDASDSDLRVFCEHLLASLKLQRFWRLRSEQMFGVLDEGELAFTLHEAAALFQT